MPNRIIFHIDVNSAFLSWEASYRLHHLGGSLDIRTIPSAVGGDISKRHGIILAKSIPAKEFHIQTGEPVTAALKKCPSLYLVPPNYSLYEQCSSAMMDILRTYSPAVEIYSIDEAFLDMTGTALLHGAPLLVANAIKDQIKQELGFTVNIGISCNKLLAKMASDFEKPDKIHTLFPDEIPWKMWPLPIKDLFFVGSATEKKLKNLGIHTIGELAETDLNLIKTHLKKQGETVWKFANGVDTSVVLPTSPANKGYGNSTTIPFDIVDAETAKKVILSLSETVGGRIRTEQVKIQVVSVGIRYYDLSYESHQRKLITATDTTYDIYLEACQIFFELWSGLPIRHLGIHTSRVSDQDDYRQLSLFDKREEKQLSYDKLRSSDQMVDEIRKRFGNDSIKRAIFLSNDGIDHQSGGISREKRIVDYSKQNII